MSPAILDVPLAVKNLVNLRALSVFVVKYKPLRPPAARDVQVVNCEENFTTKPLRKLRSTKIMRPTPY